MKQAVVIYAGTGVQLKDLIKKSKIANLVSEKELERVVAGSSNKRITILNLGHSTKLTISVPHWRMTTKEHRDSMRNLNSVDVLVYPQNNKKIQEALRTSTEAKDKSLFITYFY